MLIRPTPSYPTLAHPTPILPGSAGTHSPAAARRMSGRALVPAVLLAAGLGLAACNTVEGMGEDVQSGGRAIEKTAEDVKR